MDYYKNIPVIRGDRPDNDFLYPPGALFGYVPRDSRRRK